MTESRSALEGAARLSAALADRYRLERELGVGGMATVYLAEDIRHDRKVAIKVLKPELAAMLGAERFVVEIKTTAALQHPHILPLFDSGDADGFLFYVMPYIQGETLRTKLDRETQLGIDEAVRITRDVADALDYAHRHGVVHRDIKPENILLHDGRPMVADFGIALALSAAAGGRMTETGMSLGTPHYMSPEQATADKEISGRSDIYSLGSVLYEMLAGNPPHVGNSAQQIIMKIIAESVEPVTRYRKSVPGNVAAAVAKSLEKLPADRFATAKEFGDALVNEHFTAVVPGGAPVAGGRRKQLGTAAAFAGIAIIAFAAAWLLKGRSSVTRSQSPIYRFDVSINAPGYVTNGPTGSILADGSGFTILADGPKGRGVLMLPFDGSPPRFFAAPAAAIGGYPMPDNSGVIEYALKDGFSSQVQLIPFSGAPPKVWTDSLRYGTAVDARGRLYATHLTVGGIARVGADGRMTELLSRPDTAAGEMVHWFPTMVPGDRSVVFTISYRDGRPNRLAFLDLDAHVVHRSVEGQGPRFLPNGAMVFGTSDGTLRVVRLDGTGLALSGEPIPVLRGVLSSGYDMLYSISTNGTLLYALFDDQRWALRSSGRDTSAALTAEGGIGEFLFSETGKELLTNEGRSIWLRGRGGTANRLSVASRPHRLAGWAPDGLRIIYVEYDGVLSPYPPGVHGRLMSVRTDGIGAPEPVGRGTGELTREATSGRSGIAYSNFDGTVWWLGNASSTPVRLGSSGFGIGQLSSATLALSENGKYIAFRDSTATLVVTAVPPAVGKWIVGPGVHPRWSRDGKYLYFDQERPAYQTAALPVMRIPIIPGATFSFGKPEVASVPPASASLLWDVAPDNTVYWVTGGTSQLAKRVVVVNWAREVDSLVRASTGKGP